MVSSDFTFRIKRTALDEDYRPAENTRITTNFANLARGESRQENLRSTLRMMDNRFNSLAWRDNPRGDRYALELQIVSVEMSFSGTENTDAFPLIEILQTTIVDRQTGARIDGIEAKDYTRMGVAIRHLSHLLGRQPARHKLLVTLSDGRPDDFGDEYRGAYGVEDTRRALQEAREQGIRSYCITIDRQGADYLRHMMGPASYTVLDDVKKLPLKVADIYRKLTV